MLAFAYLVSPADGGPRSRHYPDTRIRAVILSRYAKHYGIECDDYPNEFTSDAQRIELSYDNAVLKIADSIRNEFQDEVFKGSVDFIAQSGNAAPLDENIDQIVKSFKFGIPTDGEYTMGEILSAAWDLFIGWENHSPDNGNPPSLSYISDLVLKSVEAQQFSKAIANAERLTN